jgi:serine/threonine protein kinase
LGTHPQIPDLIAYFEQDNRLYIVQEYVEGETLLARLQRQKIFSESEVREILLSLLPLLEFIHQKNIIHRNIKLKNIIIRKKDGLLFLIYFGVSKQITNTILTSIGTSIGTYGYAPSEQLRGVVFPSSDLYSLGVTCIRLLTGILP